MVYVSDECLVFYIFWLRTVTESSWTILKLDWKTLGKVLEFSSKRVRPCISDKCVHSEGSDSPHCHRVLIIHLYFSVAPICTLSNTWFVESLDNYIKYSLDFLRAVKTAEAFEAVDWLADLPQRTWLQAGRR